MTPRLLAAFVAALLVVVPDVADAQTQRDRARQEIRERCGDDRDCARRMRAEMRERGGGEGSEARRAAPATDRLVAPAVDLPVQLPPPLANVFVQLPADVQASFTVKCDARIACYRREMRAYRGQADGGQDGPQRAAVSGGAVSGGAVSGGAVGARPSGSPASGSAGVGPGADRAPILNDERPGQPALGPTPSGRRGGNLPPGATPGDYERPRPDLGGPVHPSGDNRDDEPGPYDGYEQQPDDGPESVHFFYGATTSTRLSGEGGTYDIEKQPGNGAYLIGIESEEQDDVPCGWRYLWYRDNDSDARQGYFTTRGGDCDRTVVWHGVWGTGLHRNATIDHLTDPDDDEVRAVDEIQVCMNGDGDRIKGVRVWGAHIDRNGRATSDNNLDGAFERTNCRDWSTRRSCPSGEVAVGIEVEFGDAHSILGNSDNNASGMTLICADPYTVAR